METVKMVSGKPEKTKNFKSVGWQDKMFRAFYFFLSLSGKYVECWLAQLSVCIKGW